MRKTILNLLVSTSILFTLGAMAVSGNIDLWTDLDTERFSYVDKAYPLGKMIIKAKEKKVGSGTESMLDLQIILNKKVGSRTRKKYYVAYAPQDGNLPLKVSIKKANKNGKPIGSRSEGTFLIKEANRQIISGTIFGKEVEALSFPID
ncbi:MAG: hypothetical protein DRQ88_01255 [Epsilonproteobacteria bacterium]|nr:MAG: hypothetical protein DRQ89_05325 [Campylobacterota bacterium]RLA67921.1 MAG: hypothetical protein DRQ88_01255 [Campylobacterota bacterium]